MIHTKTTFNTPLWSLWVCSNDLWFKKCSSYFQRYIDETFKGLQGKILFTFIDDIIIFADTLEEHDEKLTLIMERLEKANLQLNINKCEFLKTEIFYLGHILSKQGVSPDPRKLEAVKHFPEPQTVKNIRQFLGLAGYYRRFIKNFATMSKPLTKLLEKETNFIWNEKTQESFDSLKEALCNPPILQYPDFSKSFIITTDASGYAIGGIVSQGEIGKDLPIIVASWVLRGPELNYEVDEKEASVRFKLSEFDYEVIYKPGKLNSNTDALYRNPIYNVITRKQAK